MSGTKSPEALTDQQLEARQFHCLGQRSVEGAKMRGSPAEMVHLTGPKCGKIRILTRNMEH
jgi:hypothetical protein